MARKAGTTSLASSPVSSPVGEARGQPEYLEPSERPLDRALLGGLRPVDVGPLRRARELEALGYLHMALHQPLGPGFASTVKILA